MRKINWMKFSELDKAGIKIVNRSQLRTGAEYVGRGTPLGNQFKIGVDGNRTECIRKYRIWLWGKITKKDPTVCSELKRLYDKAVCSRSGIMLECHCRPKACHAQVIGSCLVWRASLDK